MVKQYYDRGVETQLCSYPELSAALSSDWVWEGRTLSCYLKEDGTYVQLDDESRKGTFTADNSYVSAVWTMDVSPEPVKVFLIGDSGDVSVDVTEYNACCPLGKSTSEYGTYSKAHPTITKADVDPVTKMASVDIYYQPDDGEQNGTFVTIKLKKGDSTTITKINWGWCTANTGLSGFQTCLYNEGYNLTANYEGSFVYPWYRRKSDGSFDERVTAFRERGLSVCFTSQGILNYMPNKDTVNPFLRA